MSSDNAVVWFLFSFVFSCHSEKLSLVTVLNSDADITALKVVEVGWFCSGFLWLVSFSFLSDEDLICFFVTDCLVADVG